MEKSENDQEIEDPLRKLCSSGGLFVAFETVGTLHQCAYQETAEESDDLDVLRWEVIGHGIPVVIANDNGAALCLADLDTGDKLCSFTISQSSQYTVYNDAFHIFTKPSGCFGVEFSNSRVASKVFSCLKRIVSSVQNVSEDDADEENEGVEPTLREASSDEGDNETDYGKVEPDGFLTRNKSAKRRKLMDISSPKEFKHIAHVGSDASIMDLSQVLSWKGTLVKKEHITSETISIPSSSKHESGTKESESLEEAPKSSSPPPAAAAPPPPPPPPAILPPPPKLEFKKKSSSSAEAGNKDLKSSVIDEIKKGVVLRPVNGDRISSGSQDQEIYSSIQEELKHGFVLKTRSHTMTLPMPPRKRETEQLMFEIRTFRRKKLRNTSMIDFPARAAQADENSLESILKKRLETMFHKVSDAEEFTHTGTVDSTGEDTFDGDLW